MKNLKRSLLLAALVAALPGVASAAVETKNWNWSTGDTKTISAYLNGRLDITGVKDVLTVKATGAAGAKIFGRSVDILNMSASAGCDKGKLSANVAVKVGGVQVYSLSQSKTVKYEFSTKASKSLDASTKIPFSLLGVPMSATLGVRGEAGVNFGFGITPISAKLTLKPYVRSSAYAQVGVDAWVIKVGVQGKLTILNDDLDINADVYTVVANKALNLVARFSAVNTLTLLSGSIGVYGEIGVGYFSKRGSIDLFKWNGISVKGTLFSVNKSVKLLSL